MPNTSFKYFVKDKTQDLLVPSVYAYFDFDNSGNYNNLLLNNQNWLNQSIKINASGTNIWQNSGFATFDGSYKLTINNLNYQNIGFLIPYYLSGNGKENIFISSKLNSGIGYASGYTFGINKFDYPYVEFYDYLNGPTTYCLHESVNKTGIIYFGIKTNNVELGYYDPIKKRVQKYTFLKQKNSVFDSNSWNIGGNSIDNNDKFLSGQISQIAIFNCASLDANLYEKNIVSGLISELDEFTTTGYVSGQTGTLQGDIIFLTGCYYYYAISGQFYSGEYQTGISYYPSQEIFIDCIDREYAKFTQNALSGYFSGFRWVNYLTANCFTSTSYNIYNYDSGFAINYAIKTVLPTIKYPELDNVYADSIFLKDSIDANDSLSINALKQIDRNIDYGNTLFNIFNKTYYIEGDLNINNFSGFYYNGQLQTISNNFSGGFENGEFAYLPDRDFFVSGSTIFSNKYYDFGNVNIDSWPTFDFVVTGLISSGSQMPGITFGNQMVFLNGQKLNSGIDYNNNTILINIPSGYNVLSITKNKLNFLEENISNSAGKIFHFGIFTKNTSSVWLNGLRLKNEKDYTEIIYSSMNDIFIRQNGTLIYTKNGN